jgi:hypothetical protein
MRITEFDKVESKEVNRSLNYYNPSNNRLVIKTVKESYDYYGILSRYDKDIGNVYYIGFSSMPISKIDTPIKKDGYGRYVISFAHIAYKLGLRKFANIILENVTDDDVTGYVVYEIKTENV